ncbi:hypothetical protein AB0M97_10040 [Streptomyces sp. NPDC051207]|uniref:hypothetical protein n=1 Tax=Streptomyces sp. NPDC051207 TaxID=3154641 RepID=UPI0034442134
MTHPTGPIGGIPPRGGDNDRDARGETSLGTPADTTDRTTGTASRGPGNAGAGTGAGTGVRPGSAPGAARAGATATGGPGAGGTSGTATGATPGTEGTTGTTGTHRTTGGKDATAGTGGSLLPQDECDRLALRMQQAAAGFVDGPRDAVEEADHVLEDIVAHFTEAMTNRRRGLRSSWQPDGTTTGSEGPAGDTEQLRLALKDYRDLAERLLRV